MKKKYTIKESIDLVGKKFSRDQYQLLYANCETQICKNGYLQYRLNETDKWKNVHSLINTYFNKEEHDTKYTELIETGIEKCLITHHKGFEQKNNKLNNHPDNLQWMGKQEHINYHYKLNDINKIKLKNVGDKIWNKKNEEYDNFKKQRNKIINSVTKTIIEHNKSHWNGEQSNYHRLLQSERMKYVNQKLWETTEFREIHKNQLNDLWHGANSKKFRKSMALKLSGPEAVLKKNQNKVFNIFSKILDSNESIGEDTYIKYKSYKNAPHPKTIFGSLKNAIEQYNKRIQDGN